MNTKFLTAVLASTLFSATAFAAPSAKFAATYGGNSEHWVSEVEIVDATVDTYKYASNGGTTLAMIKVPQDKELMVGVSAEIGLTTDTSIKGQEGGAAKAIAETKGTVWVEAVPVAGGTPVIAVPGVVTMASRFQELDAKLGGVLDECLVDGILESCMTEEEIGLALKTLSAQHFNFILPNMNQGEYYIKVHFGTEAAATVDIVSTNDPVIVSGSSYAKAFIGKYMVTVQQVRATADGIIDADIVE